MNRKVGGSMRRGIFLGAAALAFGVFVAVLAAEGALRVVTYLRSGTTNAGYKLEGRFMRHDPGRGVALDPGSTARMVGSEFDIEVKIGANGLRMDREIPVPRTPGVPRVLFLGDSFTFGHGVSAADRFTEQIQQSHPAWEVLNFGVSGTGTDQQLLLYRDEGQKYAADLVVLGYFVQGARRNGADVILTPLGGRPKPRFELQADDTMTLVNVPVPDSLVAGEKELAELRRAEYGRNPFKRFLRSHSLLYLFLRDRLGSTVRGAASDAALFPEYASDRPEWKVTAAIIRTLAQEVRTGGARFAVAYFPSLEEMRENAPARPRESLRRLCAEADIPFLDLTPAFQGEFAAARRRGAPLHFPLDHHWTSDGHALAAKSLGPWIEELIAHSAAD